MFQHITNYRPSSLLAWWWWQLSGGAAKHWTLYSPWDGLTTSASRGGGASPTGKTGPQKMPSQCCTLLSPTWSSRTTMYSFSVWTLALHAARSSPPESYVKVLSFLLLFLTAVFHIKLIKMIICFLRLSACFSWWHQLCQKDLLGFDLWSSHEGALVKIKHTSSWKRLYTVHHHFYTPLWSVKHELFVLLPLQPDLKEVPYTTVVLKK